MPGVDNDGRSTTLTALLDRTLASASASSSSSSQAGGGGALQPPPYDVVILLAGINDLGRGNKTAGAVFDGVVSMVDRAAAAAHYAVVVVAPWANRFVSRDSDNEAQRLKVNRALASALDGAASASPRVLLDTIEARDFRFWEMPSSDVARLQDDALHLTPAGYDRLGAELFETLSRAGVVREIKCGTVRPPKARPSRPRPAELATASPSSSSSAAAARPTAASTAARGGVVAAVTAGLIRGFGG